MRTTINYEVSEFYGHRCICNVQQEVLELSWTIRNVTMRTQINDKFLNSYEPKTDLVKSLLLIF